eukprot:198394-Amphidinium_carterae.2
MSVSTSEAPWGVIEFTISTWAAFMIPVPSASKRCENRFYSRNCAMKTGGSSLLESCSNLVLENS